MLYETAEKTVYGYIRRMNDTVNIIEDIKKMCVEYYFVKGAFVSVQNKYLGTRFEYDYEGMGYRFFILGQHTIERSVCDEHEWNIQTSNDYQGKMGIMNNVRNTWLKNGQTTLWNQPNAVCVGCHTSKLIKMCGGHFGVQDDKILGDFVGCNDILTIKLNYKENTVTFTSKKMKKKATKNIKSDWNSIRLILIFYGRNSIVEMLQ